MPTPGRADDLVRSEAWLAADDGICLEDLTVANDRPINVVAMEILTWLGWLRV
ncbi:MAG: hypothetical protein QOI85_1581 [Chloroflexota bacterium]|jgi:hypothetical protein|nr:hypothetical protein [Chloroflexota bacterium]